MDIRLSQKKKENNIQGKIKVSLRDIYSDENHVLLDETGHLDGSSFDLIEDSTWLKSLPVREDFDKGIYRHYRLFTYDDVYNIIAVSYEFAAEL